MLNCTRSSDPESILNTTGCQFALGSLVALAAITSIVIGALAYSNIYFGEIGNYGSIAMMAGGSLVLVEMILSTVGKPYEISTLALAAIACIAIGVVVYYNPSLLSGLGQTGAIAMMAGGSLLLLREMLWCNDRQRE